MVDAADTYDQLTQVRVGRTEIGANRLPWSRSIELALWHHGEGSLYVAQPLMMRQIQKDEEVASCARLGYEQAQQLMDELYRCGVRPTEGAGSVGQLGAVQAHLADMRKLVFERGNAQ